MLRNAQTVRRREQLADKHRERSKMPVKTAAPKDKRAASKAAAKPEEVAPAPAKPVYGGLGSMIGKKRRQQKVKKGGK